MLTEYLKNRMEDKNQELTVIAILKLIRDKCKTYSPDMIYTVSKYLDSGSNPTARIYAAQWLNRVAIEASIYLDADTLNILEKFLHDSNDFVKYNARAAFATKIKKQSQERTPESFRYADILTEIIATEPVILTLAGKKPHYFTYSINLPILQILNHYKVQHRKSQLRVATAIANLFGKDSSPSETLSPGWEEALKEGLKYLSKHV